MATYTWEYGAEGSDLHFTIVFDTETNQFTVNSLEGSFDLNALWWGDDIADGSSPTLSGKDSSLNMNGSGEDWDGVMKLSNTGLGKEGENKTTFVSEGESWTFNLADFGITGDFDPASGGMLGVRATSVNGGDSVKLVDKEPEFDPGDDPTDDHFPDFKVETGHDISHVTFYFETGDDPYYIGDTSGTIEPTGKGNSTTNTSDGWFTVKFDDEIGLSNDLDDWFDDALAYILAQNLDLDPSTLKGVSIYGGGEEIWYELDNDPYNDDTPPDVWKVENKEVDVTYTVDSLDWFNPA